MIDERLARLALSMLGEPGGLRMARLVADLGAERLYAGLLDGRDPHGMRTDVAGRLQDIEPERDLERAARRGIRWIVPGDAGVAGRRSTTSRRSNPSRALGGAPLGLWVRGPLRLDALPAPVAVVGARSATTYGTDVAAELGAGLARAGATVVSGAAFGIDQAAHRGAPGRRRATVAVLACGVDRAYPAAHQQLLDHLAEHCAIVSEVAPGCAPMRVRFLSRNRVIAALSRGTVVVEAAVRSGALNTASWTSRLNRPLMGVPGPVTSAPSEGVHQLIRSGAATLVTRADDVLELTGQMGEHLCEVARRPAPPATGSPGASSGCSRRCRWSARRRPTPSPARPGSGSREVESGLDDWPGRGLVERMPTGWRLADGADQG